MEENGSSSKIGKKHNIWHVRCRVHNCISAEVQVEMRRKRKKYYEIR